MQSQNLELHIICVKDFAKYSFCSPRDVSDGIRNLAKTSSRSQNIILDLCGELEVGAT